jgi:hypothetical protein
MKPESRRAPVSRTAAIVAGAALSLALGAAIPHSLAAQTLAGVVRDSVSRLPVPGVIVILLDSAGGTAARNLANERGEYRVVLRDAARRARFVRIGFEPREIAIPAHRGADAVLDVAMFALPNMLQPVHVIANSLCAGKKDHASAMGLWEQARAGLLATVVARESNPARLYRLGYERVMDGNSSRIEMMRVRTDSADTAATTFFAAHSAKDLVRYGFSTDSGSAGTFFGPDADVLLNDYFVGAYCFDVSSGGRSRPHQVGLRFAPAEHRRERIDIDGTLWIDTLARALREVEFTYVGMSAGAMRFSPGGRISFRTMPNGVVLIDQWSLRLVSARPDTVLNPKGVVEFKNWLYADETGGELARVTWPDGTEWKAPLGTLRVKALNRDGTPAAGVVIALAATDYFGITDANGLVDIGELLPGPYAVRVIDPRVAPLGIGLSTPLRFTAARDTTTLAKLTVSTAERFVADRCISSHQERVVPPGSSFVLGRAILPDGSPVVGATVSFAIRPKGDSSVPWLWIKEDVKTGDDGMFQACYGWTPQSEVMVRVHLGGGLVDIDVTEPFVSDLVVLKIPVFPTSRSNP